jgi:F-type H+-transporting ATPase subunit delta
MSDISKKYVKALVESLDKSKLADVSASLLSIVPAFKDMKLKTLLYANDISKEKKVEFLSSLIDGCDEKVVNLFKLLADNGKLDLIPSIANEMDYKVASILNKHRGVVISDKKLASKKVVQIAENLSKKFDTSIELEAVQSDYKGIKVEVESLGVEIAFSADRLKSQLSEYILKAI